MKWIRQAGRALTACALCISPALHAADGHQHGQLRQAPQPQQRLTLPPTADEVKYQLTPTNKPRYDLVRRRPSAMAADAPCRNMSTLASYSGAALADYIANLPDYECHYPLFSLDATQGNKVFAPANMDALVARLSAEAASYDGTNMKLVNLVIALRAGYYLNFNNVITPLAPSYVNALRAPLLALANSDVLYGPNPVADNTAGETLRLVTNLHDEAYYLPTVKAILARFTPSATHPGAAEPLKQRSASAGLTSALSILFYGHFRPDGLPLLRDDRSYARTVYNFVSKSKAALLGSYGAFQLRDAANEAFRFMQYPSQKDAVAAMVKDTLATSSIDGADSELWLAAASAVSFYDAANCGAYGTCNYAARLADTVLKLSYTCSPTLRIRAQEMTSAQMQQACDSLKTEEGYAHTMLQTGNKPVANDNNSSLELVVFDDYSNYQKYAGVIYDIDTNNGGMYLEGDPAAAGNQARFIAHEASWLRPTFKIWNLEHEYVHYLDGRFDMLGDFADGTAKPTVWWIEGIAEYLSLKNNNQQSIDAARSGTYRLSQIFGNTYSMADYVTRAYRWGYMAVRFMNERHRADIDAILPKFRVGDYDGYSAYMAAIGTRYDSEFASWVNSATTAGEPPLPALNLPACGSTWQLGKNCSIAVPATSAQAYYYLTLPAGAKNLRLYTTGGSGDADLYLALNRYPTTSSYDAASATAGNAESVAIASPTAGAWYYITLAAKQAFSGVTINAAYD